MGPIKIFALIGDDLFVKNRVVGDQDYIDKVQKTKFKYCVDVTSSNCNIGDTYKPSDKSFSRN